MAKKINWIDATSYSQGCAERIPKTWELRTNNLRIIVTRRIHHDGWWLSVHVLDIEDIELCSEDIVEAQREALIITKKRLEQLTREFDKATGAA